MHLCRPGDRARDTSKGAWAEPGTPVQRRELEGPRRDGRMALEERLCQGRRRWREAAVPVARPEAGVAWLGHWGPWASASSSENGGWWLDGF